MTKRFSLDGTQLKFLALLFMLIDHIHYFFECAGNRNRLGAHPRHDELLPQV